MLKVLRILIALACLYAFWRFRNSTLGQGTFISAFVIAAVGIFVEDWFKNQVLRKDPRDPNPRTRGGRTSPGAPYEYGEYSRIDNRGYGAFGLSDFMSGLGITLTLAIMADSFWFTTWLELPPASGQSGSENVVTGVKVIAGLLAIITALFAPLVLAVLAYLASSDWLAARSRNPQSTGGCAALFPAALVAVAGYGHFYLAYLFYQSLGVLRPSN